MHWSEEELEEYMKRIGKSSQESVKKSKYNNSRIKRDGILFDSTLEADYYDHLKLQLKAGTILGFCRQPEFILLEGFADQKPETYKADFIIFNLDGTAEVADTKGFQTEIFKIKHKQFRAKFPGLELKIVTEF